MPWGDCLVRASPDSRILTGPVILHHLLFDGIADSRPLTLVRRMRCELALRQSASSSSSDRSACC